jgi:hypothetical protein
MWFHKGAFRRHNSGFALIRKPDTTLYFDQKDDYVTIKTSSTTGSAFDKEYNTPFTLGGKLEPLSSAVQRIFHKLNNTTRKGYYSYIKVVSGTSRIALNISYSTTQEWEAYTPSVDLSNGLIYFAGWDGASAIKIRTYTTKGVLSTSTILGPFGAVQTISIKNTLPLYLGGSPDLGGQYKGFMSHPAFFNIMLSDAQMDSAAALIAADKLKTMTNFNSINTAYWRSVAKGEWVNERDETLNGIITN